MSAEHQNYRALEEGIHTDLKDRLSYSKYLDLDQILNAQHPRTEEHDEMLFIIIHQASELWLKLAGFEVQASMRALSSDNFGHAFKAIARVKLILSQLTQSWSILATMTPADYLRFRDSLGPSSGFQSYSYRALEFLLGNKNAAMAKVHAHDEVVCRELTTLLHAPSLYDITLQKLQQAGFAIDESCLERDFSQPYAANDSVATAWLEVYRKSDEHFELYELAEKLVDVEDAFQAWRFKHMYTVTRIIGNRMGTGGSSGVPFLKRALDMSFFPELFTIRTQL
ncbi:MAG: tryptophan 2,3-dioxygenase family protein [Pseudomonadota bacterium]